MSCWPLLVCILGTRGHTKSRVMKCMCSWSDVLQEGEGMSDVQESKLCMCKCVCACTGMQHLCRGKKGQWRIMRRGRDVFGTGGAMNSRQGLLSLHRARQLLVAVAWAMAGELWGMLGNDTLLLGSWMEQKGVDGFSLFLFFIFSRLDRQVAVATTRRRSPAHLHHKQGVLPRQT